MSDKIYIVLTTSFDYNDESYLPSDGYEIISCHWNVNDAEIKRAKTKEKLKKEFEPHDLYEFVYWEDSSKWDSETFLELWKNNNYNVKHKEPLDEFVIIKEYEIK